MLSSMLLALRHAQARPKEAAMKRRTIWLIAVLTFGFLMAPLAAEAFEEAVRTVVGHGTQALLVVPALLFTEQRHRLAELAVQHRLLTMWYRREQVEAGGLMSYGTSFSDMYRRAAVYVDKILKGAKPADLPVEQPMKLELVINLKTAKALGLTIPPTLLFQADEVIQ